MYKEPYTTWIIDVEFFSLSHNKSPVPFWISIRGMHGENLLYTRIDYDGKFVHQVHNEVKPFMTKIRDKRGSRDEDFKRAFVRHYGGNRTGGMSITAVREKIFALGYTDRHRLLCWGTVQDTHIFRRIMTGTDDVVVPKTPMDPYMNVKWLCSKMLPPRTGMELEMIHPRIVQDSVVEFGTYHKAKNDTAAMAEVVKTMVFAKG